MDPMDHEADSGHNDNMNPGRADESSFDARFPRAVWDRGGKGPSIDQAFSGPDPSKTEFPLARALRTKAKSLK